MCGTDGTEFGCEWTNKALADADIGEDASAKILYRNADAMMSRALEKARLAQPPPRNHGQSGQRGHRKANA